ncbi:replication initiation protein [Cytophagaceae bacterium DM2B3-1]|uniref:Replication initiation protein n=1 Tax=Xanthocytophaga flava TaxID=3048013 RepID=A0ABT7CV12_9BACT|nr:replication initiation protein [Xanthocytophaga flavus]MDJ1497610.1 replication initiation protein [Xanthocytophaga flavus]
MRSSKTPKTSKAQSQNSNQISLFGNGTSHSVRQSLTQKVEDIKSENIKEFNELIIAQHDMNVYERRIFISLLENLPAAYRSIDSTSAIAIEPVMIDVRRIMDESGLIGQSGFSELKKATAEMIKHVCKIENAERYLQVSLLSSAEYFKKEGKIEIRIDPKLLPYLLRLKEDFETNQLAELMQFQSRYSQCFYELFKRESKQNSIVYIDIVRLRSLLGIEDVYERYNDVKRKVIQQAQRDLLPYPDVSFTFREKKVSGKVEGIFFYLKQMLPN